MDPSNAAASDLLVSVLEGLEKWDELERVYRSRAENAPDEQELARATAERAALLDEKLGRPEAAKRCYEALLQVAAVRARVAAPAPALRQGRRPPRAPGAGGARARVPRGRAGQDPGAARDGRDREGEGGRPREGGRVPAPDHRAGSQPLRGHRALRGSLPRQARLARSRGSLRVRGQRGARRGRTCHPDIIRRLEELAQVAEMRLGDVERAIAAWRRSRSSTPPTIVPASRCGACWPGQDVGVPGQGAREGGRERDRDRGARGGPQADRSGLSRAPGQSAARRRPLRGGARARPGGCRDAEGAGRALRARGRRPSGSPRRCAGRSSSRLRTATSTAR